ncbi:hypothetical protein OS493_040615, partial [Desmophyllum pertusum]
IHRLFGRNKENHGTHSGKEDSENEDSSLRLKLNVPTTRHKQFTKVLAEIRERAMPSSLGRRRSKTQSECPSVDTRNSGDSDSGSRPRASPLWGSLLVVQHQTNFHEGELDGTFSSQEKESTDEVDGQIDSEKLRQRVEHLNHKIKKTKDQIRQLQDERDEYVKEYLEEGSQKS